MLVVNKKKKTYRSHCCFCKKITSGKIPKQYGFYHYYIDVIECNYCNYTMNFNTSLDSPNKMISNPTEKCLDTAERIKSAKCIMDLNDVLCDLEVRHSSYVDNLKLICDKFITSGIDALLFMKHDCSYIANY